MSERKGRKFGWDYQVKSVTHSTEPASILNVYRNKYSSDVQKLNTYIEEFFNYDEKRKRAIVVEPLVLEEIEQKVDDKDKKKNN
jgi:hypothetical protein